MDDDSIFRRVNAAKVNAEVKKRSPGADTMAITHAMIRILNRKVASAVNDFENGDGDFQACYFDAVKDLGKK